LCNNNNNNYYYGGHHGNNIPLVRNLLSSNISSTHFHNMVNFGPLAAKIGLVVWGTPPNFSGFRVLALLLHRAQQYVVGVRQTLWR